MKEMGKIWMNGKMINFKDAKIHVLTHALHYSTSVFEGIRCYNTPKGSAIFRLDDHVDRLFASAKMYSMKMQYSKKQVVDAIIKTVQASGLKECYIRPLAYYGYGTMGVTPSPNKVDLSISCWDWKVGGSKSARIPTAKCKISSWAKIDSRSQPMKAKSSSNYSNAALARVEALEDGYDEAIMLNYYGKVTEASAENIFIVKRGEILTPPPSAGILEGITRDSLIQMIEEREGVVIEVDLERDDLYGAEEIFLTGTAAEIKSVTQIDKVKIGTGKAGRITQALQKSFIDVVTGKDRRFDSWLKYI